MLVALLATTVVTAAYATRTFLLLTSPQVSTSEWVAAPERRYSLTAVPVLLAVAVLGLGVAGFAVPALRPELGESLLTLLLVALGVLGGVALTRRAPARLLAGAFGTDTIYERTVVPAVWAGASAVLRIDDGLVGGTVTRTGRGAWLLGGGLRLTQNGNVQFYVTGLLVGVLLLAAGVVVR